MPIAYRYKEGDKPLYDGTAERQYDPLQSEIDGHDVYLIPANCTLKEPPAEKEGFEIWYDKDKDDWYYKEIEKEPEPEPYVPTPLDEARNELWEYESKLRDMDYIGTKIATGRATIEDYADKIALMSEYAEKVDELRATIKELEEEAE